MLKDGELYGIVNIDNVLKFAVQEMELESDVLHDVRCARLGLEAMIA